jgi:Protein of unknown function (DUF3050)
MQHDSLLAHRGDDANRVDDLRRLLLRHPIYTEVNSITNLKLFMEDHVFAVWDFMSLLKRLQRDMTCTTVPWFPVDDSRAARLINEIVIGEECDLGPDGVSPVSHLELYLRAMEEIGADTEPFRKFCKIARTGIPLSECLLAVDAPLHVCSFVSHTMELATRSTTEEVLGAFFYGREDVIPEMFQNLQRSWQPANSEIPSYFDYYIRRHIELDGDSHGPMGKELLGRLVSGSPERTKSANLSAAASIEQRIHLWNGTLEKIYAWSGHR